MQINKFEDHLYRLPNNEKEVGMGKKSCTFFFTEMCLIDAYFIYLYRREDMKISTSSKPSFFFYIQCSLVRCQMDRN